LTERPREQPAERGGDDRYVSAAVKRAVWERDQGSCTWPMGDGKLCGSTHRLEFDHDLEVALGGEPTIDNIRLLCKSHNLMKAENRFGREFMAGFRRNSSRPRPSIAQK
jgi:5-methylcytosine-specific restriction endonuclease McrA